MSTDHKTPEQAAEILAREMYVEDAVHRAASGSRRPSAHWRGIWNLEMGEPGKDGWRKGAAALLAALAESGLELTWKGKDDATVALSQHLIDDLTETIALHKRAQNPDQAEIGRVIGLEDALDTVRKAAGR